MSIELNDAYNLLVTLHDCAALSSKPLNKWLAPKPLTDEQCVDMLIEVCRPGAEAGPHKFLTAPQMAVAFARAIERAHGIGE